MSKKMILLALTVSLAFIIGACASVRPIDPAMKGKIGDPVAPANANVIGGYGVRGPAGGIEVPTDQTQSSVIGTDETKTLVAKGKIGDPVAPANANVIGGYGVRGAAGGVEVPTDQTQSGALK